MQVRAAAATHEGLVRPANEDSFHCGDAVFAVADGLGGHAAGEVASALAVGPMRTLAIGSSTTVEDAHRALTEAVTEANRRILDESRGRPDRAGMGTTLTAAAVVGGRLLVAHVGDSRAYLLRDGDLRQVTHDHTQVYEAMRQGLLSRDEAASHPGRHVLSRALGLEPDPEVDAPDPVALEVGDRVLLCSDGLTEAVGDDLIAGVLGLHDDPGLVADDLVRAALEGGGPDNVTVVVVLVEP